eukprot:m.93331 g.93331  ORF g.93331 m.93331 type:complete len:128 (+) comp51193_c0_seq16:183-566(+)
MTPGRIQPHLRKEPVECLAAPPRAESPAQLVECAGRVLCFGQGSPETLRGLQRKKEVFAPRMFFLLTVLTSKKLKLFGKIRVACQICRGVSVRILQMDERTKLDKQLDSGEMTLIAGESSVRSKHQR